jgi:hypothetical protein
MERAEDGTSYLPRKRCLDFHHAIEWGVPCKRHKYANRSCGVSIWYSREMFWHRDHVRRVYDPPPDLQSRIGAARLKTKYVDWLPIVAYFPNRSSLPASEYCRVVCRLCDTIEAWATRAPKRCTVMLYVDLNDGLGLQQLKGGAGHEKECTPDEHIGNATPSKEHFAGQQFRKLLAATRMAAANTFSRHAQHTFVGSCGQKTKIDYVCLPLDLVHLNHEGCRTFEEKTTNIQPFNTLSLRDHILIGWSGWIQVSHGPSFVAPEIFDRDKLMRAYVQGVDAEACMREGWNRVNETLSNDLISSDDKWDAITDTLRNVVAHHFPKNGSQSEEHAKRVEERKQALADRSRLRQLNASLVQKYDALQAQLQDLSRGIDCMRDSTAESCFLEERVPVLDTTARDAMLVEKEAIRQELEAVRELVEIEEFGLIRLTKQCRRMKKRHDKDRKAELVDEINKQPPSSAVC